jgi:hypothetical protein
MIYFYFIFKTFRLYKWSNFHTVIVILKTATVLNAPKMKFKIQFISRQQNSKMLFFLIFNFFFQFSADLIPTTSSKTKESDQSKNDEFQNGESKSDDLLLRQVTVTRRDVDDKLFGLLIRRSTKNGIPVLTVESGHDEADLVPGDQLIAVDGVSVEDQDREVVVKLLAECLDSQVTLKVGQTAALFCGRITYFTFTCLSFLK